MSALACIKIRYLLAIAVSTLGLMAFAAMAAAPSASQSPAPGSVILDQSAQVPSSAPINLYITDFGIKQWKKELRLGGDLSRAENRLLDPNSGAVGIAVPMPSDAEFNSLSSAKLRERIRKVVAQQIRASIQSLGTTTFEIQLIEHISIPGYADPIRQRMVDRFGTIAYAAIGEVIADLQHDAHMVRTRSFTLSNGTKVLAANIASLYYQGKLYLEGVDLANGRAMKEPTSRLISAVGAQNVRLFATRGDWFGLPGASIGNFDTLVELKDLHPGIRLYLLTPQSPKDSREASHTAILHPDQLFSVQEYIGNGLLISASGTILRSQELLRLPSPPGSLGPHWHAKLDDAVNTTASITLAEKLRMGGSALQKPLIRVDEHTAQNLLSVVTAYTSVLKVAKKSAEELAEIRKKWPHEDPALHAAALEKIAFFRNMPLNDRERVLLKGAEFVQFAMGIVDGLQKDLEDNSYGRVRFISSHTMEAIGHFGLDLIDFLDDIDLIKKLLPKGSGVNPALKFVGGMREITTGVAKHVGSGNADVDIVTHYLKGSKALLAAELGRRHLLKSNFALLDGLQELGTATYKTARGDVLSPDLVTEYLEAVNNLAWTGLGMAACGAHYGCTKAIQTFGTTLAKVLRTGTEQWFADVLVAFSGNSSQILGDYLQLQQVAIAHHRPMQTISEVYTRELLRKNGMSEAQIDRLDALVIAQRSNIAASTTNAAAVANTVKDDRGGIDLDTGTPLIIEQDMSSVTRSVLGPRP